MQWEDYLYGYDDGFMHGRSGKENSGCNLLFSLSRFIICIIIFLLNLFYLLIKSVIEICIYLLTVCLKLLEKL